MKILFIDYLKNKINSIHVLKKYLVRIIKMIENKVECHNMTISN